MQTPNNNRGMTLIEVMVTMVVFAVGVLGIITLQLNAVHANVETRNWDEANRILASHVERIGMGAYNSLVNADGNTGSSAQLETWRADPFEDSSLGTSMETGLSRYALRRFVTENLTQGTKTVFFCVSWPQGTQEKRIFRTVVKPPDREG
ncbi:hypothetical protein DSLASN_48910 [Desulfoluna limicola]|uniref:Type IV pilus modification protein PilV n=1 Tax=Desulfoluna limicola TaxID=2810562 RepID=A0ABM7PPY5_9BACT|nr:prepilin-type N-terminal cleavage/methylation domain-containing protein [Desulfoluna limicola]BCS99259.1 hypothetical protein DSLASN_48910 [Desulfoluna limicola]